MNEAPRKADEVYELLLNRFMSAAIEPGARITVDALARELGVSQTPIREALGRLEAEGLVTKTPLAGYRAAPRLSRESFEQMFDMRLQLEPFLAGRAAAAMTDQRADELHRLLMEMSELARARSAGGREAYGEFARRDALFHDAIADWGGNVFIHDALSRLRVHLQIFRLIFSTGVTSEAVDEHDEIARALIKRDPLLAEAAMRSHIQRSRRRLRVAFEQFPTAPQQGA